MAHAAFLNLSLVFIIKAFQIAFVYAMSFINKLALACL